jgi:hypothetical protein
VLPILARFSAAFAQDALFPGDSSAALAQTSGGGAGDRDMNAKGLRRVQDGIKREWGGTYGRLRPLPHLIHVGLGGIARVATDRT